MNAERIDRFYTNDGVAKIFYNKPPFQIFISLNGLVMVEDLGRT
jgi:hypothetical protein